MADHEQRIHVLESPGSYEDETLSMWSDAQGEHPRYTILDWRNSAAAGYTLLGYVDWVSSELDNEITVCDMMKEVRTETETHQVKKDFQK